VNADGIPQFKTEIVFRRVLRQDNQQVKKIDTVKRVLMLNSKLVNVFS
jgi:hypothetical protein